MSQTVPSSSELNLTAQGRRNTRLAAICALVFALMVGAAFASVPLYKAFCQLTGFGGTVRKAEAAPGTVLARPISIRFDSNVRGLPLTFNADQGSQTLKICPTGLAFFKCTNNGSTATNSRAPLNVLDAQAGA